MNNCQKRRPALLPGLILLLGMISCGSDEPADLETLPLPDIVATNAFYYYDDLESAAADRVISLVKIPFDERHPKLYARPFLRGHGFALDAATRFSRKALSTTGAVTTRADRRTGSQIQRRGRLTIR